MHVHDSATYHRLCLPRTSPLIIEGTSTLMSWLGAHPQIQCPQVENYSLMEGKPGQLVQDVYAMASYDEHYIRGYKNPIDIFVPNTSMKLLDKYFPKTKLIITLRHPVRYVSFLGTIHR